MTRFILALILMSSWSAALAAEADREWEGDTSADWSVATNWNGDAPPDADDRAIFSDTDAGTTPQSVDLAGPRSFGRLQFNSRRSITLAAGNTLTLAGATDPDIEVTGGSHTIACDLVLQATANDIVVAAGASLTISGDVTLGMDTTVDVGTGGTLTISGDVSGAFLLTKTGAGTLILSGSNSYAGDTTVSAGTLQLASSGSINGTASVSVQGTGQLALTGSVFPAAKALTLNSSTVPALRGISGFNVYSGSVTLASASTLQADAGTLVVGGPVVNGGFLLTGAGAGETIVSGAISGSGGLTKAGNGTLTLLGANTYTGTTTVSVGTLVAQSAAALGDNGAAASATTVTAGAALVLDGSIALSSRESITLNGNGGSAGALQVRSGSPSIAGALTLASASTITALNAGSTLTVSGLVTASTLLTYQGAGTLLLSNTGNHAAATGGVAVTNGTLRLGAANAWPSGAATINGTLDLNATSPVITGALSGGGSITSSTAGAATLTVASGTFSGALVNGSGTVGLTVNGGSLTMSGASTYSGATTITNGTLIVSGDGACDSTSISIGGGSTLQVSGSINLAAPITFASGAANTIASVSGDNTLSGTVTVAQPTNYPVISATGGTLTLSQNMAGSGSVSGLTVGGTGNVVFQGSINLGGSGPRAVSKTDSGRMTVTSATIGSFSLYDGTLAFSSGTPLGTSSVTLYGGTLAPFGGANLTVSNNVFLYGDCTVASALTGTLTFSGGVAVGPVAADVTRTLTVDDATGTVRSLSITGAITGEGSTSTTLVKAGSDTLVLGGASANTLTGISVQAGLLQAASAGRIPSGAAVDVSAGATLDLNDFAASVSTLTGAGTVDLGATAITVTGSSSFGGVITGVSGSLVVNGTLTLSGASTYTGTTAVAGTLTLVGDAGSINLSPIITLPVGATLAITSAGTANPNRILDTADIQMSGGTFSITAPSGTTRSETVGKFSLSGASTASIQVVATGTANCVLTASDATNGLVDSSTAVPEVNVTRTDASGGGKAFFFIQGGYADNSTVAHARVNGGNAKYTFGSGLIATTIDWYSRGAVAEWASVTWYDAPTGGTQRAGFPNSSSDSVYIMSPVQIGSSYNCARLVMTTDGTLAGTYDSAYLNITDGTSGAIQTTSGAPTITGLGLYSSGQPMNFDVSAGCTLTITGAWNGSNYHVLFINAMSKTGDGTLDVQVPTWPGYQGATTISQGILRLGYNNGSNGFSRPAACPMSVVSPGVLELAADQTSNAGFSGNGTVRAVGAARVLSLQSATFNGVIADGSGAALSLVATTDGSSTVDLAGANTFTGGATVSGGNLRLIGGAALHDDCPVTLGAAGGALTVIAAETIGPIQGGSAALVLNAALTVNQGATSATYSGASSGSGSLTITGTSGTLLLSGTNTHTGGTILASGTVAILQNRNLGAAAGQLTFAGGRLQLSADVNMTAAAISADADATTLRPVASLAADLAADRPIAVTTADGTIDMAGFSLAMPAFTTTAGQDLRIFSSSTATTTLSTDQALFLKVAGNRTMAGLLAAGSGGDATKRVPFVVVTGGSRLELSGANTMQSNVWRIEGGSRVALVSAAGLGSVSGSGWIYTLPTSALELAGVSVSGIRHYLSGSLFVTGGDAAWAGRTDMHVAATASVPTCDVQGGRVLTLSGQVSGTDAWAKSGGAGELRLTAAAGVNDATGGVTVSAGVLSVARDDQLGAAGSTLTLSGGGTLAVTGSFTSSRGVTLGAGGGTCSVPTGLTLNLTGVIDGSGGLAKTGSGTLALGGTNTFSGGSQVQAGVLQVGVDGALGNSASSVTLDGGSLRTTANLSADPARGLAIGASGGTIDTDAATTLTWNGVLSGSGSLAKTSGGTLVLSGANGGYTGSIAVQAGALRATTSSALGGTGSGTSVANGAALELSGTFTSAEPLQLAGAGVGTAGVIRSLTGDQTLSGAIALVQTANPATISVGGTLVLSGAITGSGGLSKISAGDLTLSGGNTFTGLVTVGSGRLLVSANTHLGDAGNGVTLDGGTLVVGASFSASGRLLRITANDGVISLPAGGTTLQVPGLDTAVGQDLTLAGAGTLNLNIASGGSTIAGALVSSGTAALTKSGTGGLAITAANASFTGTTTLVAGPVRLDGSLGGPVVVQSGATLGGTGSMGALSVQSGGTVKPGDPQGQSPGVLTAASLTLATGAILDYDLGTANDLISVTGAASVAAGVQLNVLSFPAPASFADGSYALINAGVVPTYAGGMTASLPNSYSLSAGLNRATIGVAGKGIILQTDSTEPVVSAITSASPDGTYYEGQSFGVTVQFSKPITPVGAVLVQLALNNGGAPVVRSVPVTAGSYPASQLSGTYTILSGDITAPGEVNATDVELAAPITDAVGHSVSGTLTTAGTLSSNKNIIIDNFVPLVQLHTATAGDTQPPAVAMDTLDARLFNSTGSTADEVLVLASDQETSDPTQFSYRILLEPSQGEVQLLTSGTWGTGTTMRVVTTITDPLTQVDTFTQADIDAGTVRYKHGSLSGGNDAILFDVTDGDGKTSALYLLRFVVTGDAVPVIDGLPPSLTYVEESTHAVWMPLTSSADVVDNAATFPDGTLSIAMTGAQSGDQLDLRPDATGVSETGGRIAVGSVEVGSLTRLSATSLLVQFDDPTTAGPAAAAAIINAMGYRTTALAPDPTQPRTIQVSLTDGSVGQIPNVYVVPVQITLYNDPPVVTVGPAIATVPGLVRTFTVSVSDPEGDTDLDFAIAPPPAPQATRGTLIQTTDGVFSYTPYYPSSSSVGDVLQDVFAITVTDQDFDPGSADPRRRGTATAATSAPAAYTVRITDGGGDAPRFLAPMRMTVAAGLPFFFQPNVEAASGAVLTWELVGAPAQLTAAIGASEASFDETSGQLSWPIVPAPADASGYYRFSIMVTDTVHRTATLLPVMLRVGPGGAG